MITAKVSLSTVSKSRDVANILIPTTEVKRGEMGNIVLGMPLAPTGFRTLWQDDSRFQTGYLDRFGGTLLDTGDAGMVDNEVNC